MGVHFSQVMSGWSIVWSKTPFLCHNFGQAMSNWPQATSNPEIWGAAIPRSWCFYRSGLGPSALPTSQASSQAYGCSTSSARRWGIRLDSPNKGTSNWWRIKKLELSLLKASSTSSLYINLRKNTHHLLVCVLPLHLLTHPFFLKLLFSFLFVC